MLKEGKKSVFGQEELTNIRSFRTRARVESAKRHQDAAVQAEHEAKQTTFGTKRRHLVLKFSLTPEGEGGQGGRVATMIEQVGGTESGKYNGKEWEGA